VRFLPSARPRTSARSRFVSRLRLCTTSHSSQLLQGTYDYLPLSPTSEAANPASWIWRPSFERQRDFNPHEQRALLSAHFRTADPSSRIARSAAGLPQNPISAYLCGKILRWRVTRRRNSEVGTVGLKSVVLGLWHCSSRTLLYGLQRTSLVEARTASDTASGS
jgi:hypothetical protein